MTEPERNDLLEIYKLHAELADRVSQRREGANRLYVSLLVGLAVFAAAALRFGSGDVEMQYILLTLGIVGILLSVSWFIVIRSYRQLNTEKFRVLLELEKQLAYPFFTKEWDPEGEGRQTNDYWTLTNVERTLPAIFVLLFAGLVVYSFLY